MLLGVRMAAVARLAAALMIVAMSGAPRVLALHAPEPVHRCTCLARAGEHHECGCAMCHKAALAAQASDDAAPPCHRAAARKALADREPRADRGAACLEGTCGATDRQPVTVAGIDPCVVPASPPIAVADRVEPRAAVVASAPDAPREPETPPPKTA